MAREQIFLEAVDCFCCMVPKKGIREKMMHVISKGILLLLLNHLFVLTIASVGRVG